MKTHHPPFTLDAAIVAHEQNRLLEWTITYLESEDRNKVIADHIRDRHVLMAVLREYPLALLKRIEGPQNGETEPKPLHEWVARVDEIKDEIATKNASPGPLIVTDFWGKLEIADGNHRHEAFLKSGYEKYWTIFLLTTEESIGKISS